MHGYIIHKHDLFADEYAEVFAALGKEPVRVVFVDNDDEVLEVTVPRDEAGSLAALAVFGSGGISAWHVTDAHHLDVTDPDALARFRAALEGGADVNLTAVLALLENPEEDVTATE